MIWNVGVVEHWNVGDKRRKRIISKLPWFLVTQYSTIKIPLFQLGRSPLSSFCCIQVKRTPGAVQNDPLGTIPGCKPSGLILSLRASRPHVLPIELPKVVFFFSTCGWQIVPICMKRFTLSIRGVMDIVLPENGTLLPT